MKKARIPFLLLAGVLLLAGCQKEGKIGGKDAIRFTAASNPGTKAEYATGEGSVVDGVQRINWLVDDEIRIFSDKAVHRNNADQPWADYIITEVSNSGTVSKGKIDNVPGDGTGNGLVWGEAGKYRFYSIYPNGMSAGTDAQGKQGILVGEIPGVQSGDAAELMKKYGMMTAATEVTTTTNGEGTDVTLDFSPAFTAFEFDMTADIPVKLINFKLMAANTANPLAGKVQVSYASSVTAPSYSLTGSGRTIKVDFNDTKPSIGPEKEFKFTVFALPYDLTDLTIEFTILKIDTNTEETRSLTLKKADGTFVKFAGFRKHIITATMQGSYNFKYITLDGEVINWNAVPVETASDKLPQASQFAVSGRGVKNVYELHPTGGSAYRQTWALGSNTATVSFKVFTPEGGKWKVVPQGATDKFEVTYDGSVVRDSFEGHINSRSEEQTEGATIVTFTVKPTTAVDGDRIYFKTYVLDKEGNQYSLDSETQLYDTRGYHYFQINDPLQ
ncbi:MAG: hypothetical protein IJM89_06970 [Bacteroidales bacterium]|nr:hypothetical protein [Bacteroidales bacterium]